MASPQPQPFATLLRRHRLAAGLTQEALAAKAGLSVGAIGVLERGLRRIPHRDTVVLLADGLGLAPPERTQLGVAARLECGATAVLPAPAVVPAMRTAAPPLVGRARELARLDCHLAGDGAPLLLLAGEPGIGKSRLLHEAAARARDAGWTVLAGGCTRRSGQEPYAPLLGALARFVAARPPALLRADLQGCAWLVRLLPELAEWAVVPAPAWALSPEQERRLMVAAVERFLANVAGPAGTLLVLDDLQWAGPDAHDLLAALAHSAAGRSLRLLGAFRQTEPGAAPALGALPADLARAGLVDELALGPLAPDEAGELLRHLLGGTEDTAADEGAGRVAVAESATESARERVVRRADGVPYFLVCFAQALLAGAPPGTAADAVPWGVRLSIRQRVAALAADGQETLRLAAVAGRRVPRWLLLAASVRRHAGRTAVDGLEAACRAGLLLEDGPDGYRFAHEVVREVVVGDQSAARRAELQLRITGALERGPVAQFARHCACTSGASRATMSRQRCAIGSAARPRRRSRARSAAGR